MTDLYHGTRIGAERGGWITPAAFHGHQANELPGYEGADGWLFLTPDPDVAATFARTAKGRGRPKILTVVPDEPVEPDHATLNGEDGLMFRTRGWARITSVQIIDERD